MVVCEHNAQRWEPDSKEEAEATTRALAALAAEPKQLRFQAPSGASASVAGSRRESERGGMALMRRSLSMMTRSSSREAPGASAAAGGAAARPPDLSRASSGSVRSLGGASAAGSAHGGPYPLYATLHVTAGHPRGLPPAPHQPLGPHPLQRMRSDRTTSTVLSSEGAGAQHRLVSVGSPVKGPAGWGSGRSHSVSGVHSYSRRSTYAGPGSLAYPAGELLAGVLEAVWPASQLGCIQGGGRRDTRVPACRYPQA